MNYKETQDKVYKLQDEARNAKTVSEFIKKIQEAKKLASDFNEWLDKSKNLKEETIRNLINEEKQTVKNLILSKIKGYDLEFHLRQDSYYYQREMWFRFTPTVISEPEHDWEIEEREEESDHEWMMDDPWMCHPFFGPPSPRMMKRMKGYYNDRYKPNERDYNKITLNNDGTTSAVFKTEKIMKDLEAFKEISDEIVKITSEYNQKIKDVPDMKSTYRLQIRRFKNIFDSIQEEFPLGKDITFKFPFSYKDEKGKVKSTTIAKVIKPSSVNTKVFVDDKVLVSKPNIELIIHKRFDNDIKEGAIFKFDDFNSVKVLGVKDDEVKYVIGSPASHKTKTSKLGKFIETIIEHS